MSGFVNTSDATINPGGFLNTTTGLEVTSSALPVDVTMQSSLPPGSNFLGFVDLQGGLPAGSNDIGTVTIKDGATVVLQNGTSVAISGSLPSGTNQIGIVQLASGATVAFAPNQTVGIAGTATVQGSVSVTALPNVTIAAMPNVTLVPGQTISVNGTVNIGTMPSVTVGSMPAVSIAPGQSIAVTGVNITSVGLNAGTNAIGTVALNAAIPAGTNHLGKIEIDTALPVGTNSIGTVGLNAGTNLIGKVDIQGIDQAGTKHQVALDTAGHIVPPRVEVSESIITLLANTSTTILNTNPDRLLWRVQLVDIDNVIISESGAALSSLSSPGTVIYSGGSAGAMYVPPFVSTLAVTALCGQTTTVRVTEYTKV